jgi:hypothetical protein
LDRVQLRAPSRNQHTIVLELSGNQDGRFYQFTSKLILDLAKTTNAAKVIGYDFTPPPFHEKLRRLFRASEIQFTEQNSWSIYELASESDLIQVIATINWNTQIIACIVTGESMPVPQPFPWYLQYRAREAWFYSCHHQFDAVCVIRKDPRPALEIITSKLLQMEVLATVLDAARTIDAQFTNSQFHGKIGKIGDAGNARNE